MKVLIPDGNCSWLLQTICMLCLMCTSCTLRIDVLEPMLFLPGLMGSMIESRATTGNPIPSYCEGKLTNEYEITWLSVTRAFHGECFAETMRLYLRNVTSVDSSFVESRTPPDNIYATSYIDPANVVTRSKTQYYAEFYEYLVGKGYELYKNLDAIAYDWRQSPYNFFQPGDYFDRLKSRIELMFNQNQGKKITLVGHSMGGATTALFLSSFVDSEWKEKYVKQFISIAGVYGGSVKALRAVTTGIGSVLSEYLTRIAKHLPGVHSLVPIGNSDELVVWGNSTVFQLGNQAYTADQIPQLYKDLNLEAYAPVIEQLRSVGYQKPPGVPVHCLMTVNVATMVGIIVHSKSADDLENPKFLEGLGDGTVPARSLQVCSSWAHAQSQPVQSQLFNSDHEKMVSDVAVWEYVFKSANGLEF